MRLRTYQAYKMREAMEALTRDLGSDAVIVNTRTFRRGGVLGLGARTVHELTATTSRDAAAASAVRAAEAKRRAAASLGRGPVPGGGAARRAYANGAAVSSASSAPSGGGSEALDMDAERAKTVALARTLMAQRERDRRPPASDTQAAAAGRTNAVRDAAPGAPPHAVASPAGVAGPDAGPIRDAAGSAPPRDGGQDVPAGASVARRFVLQPVQAGAASVDAAVGAASVAGAAAPPAAGLAEVAASSIPAAARAVPAVAAIRPRLDAGPLFDELAAIRSMVGRVLHAGRRGGASSASVEPLPEPLFEWYLRLLGQDMSEELADQVTRAVLRGLGPDGLADDGRVREAVLAEIAGLVPVADEPLPAGSPDGRPLTIALVGPTGVGKTTTLAKLAAAFHLREGRSVGLVTADTYRIAAVEQLRTYAGIIGLDLHVARTPHEMRHATVALADRDVVLVDTAGRSQNDTDRLAELRDMVAAADPHEVHLVLSGTASEKTLRREAQAFMPLGVDKVVLTKLDEAVSFGMLVEAVSSIGARLSFVTTGQDVPDHIERAGGRRLAELLAAGCEAEAVAIGSAVPAGAAPAEAGAAS